ncbi:acyl-homoserine-lactone acylase [Fontimonas thermophila]|uniref:Acyl-homoserine-lactone acylase n=1 Tax=Fontimonas thermophila TaxID=1076937 RepID=A0A1I2HC70_9GAMM|nr:penicillin acylase family protein [Fontimonas thermophila]SFF27252.1 acyl-homoserine-lactone acylase [Fontimonas thermophila]
MRTWSFVSLAGLSLLFSACNGSSTPVGAGTTGYSATVTRTALGIPHIRANDFAGIGYGYGYAFAEDNLCVLYDDLLTIRGERARYLGPNGTYTIPANDSVTDNVTSDFFWKLMANDEAIARLKAASVPEIRDATRGFVAGFNRYIREIRAGGHPNRHAACRDAEYLQPIREDDMYRRYFRLAVLAGTSVFADGIGSAQPPSPTNPVGPVLGADELRAALAHDLGPLAFFRQDRPFGSNMYAIGPQGSATGESMVFGNPHFPWEGSERLYIAHATIPGKLDIMGASLYGVPAILIGFNDHLAWSHTVSTAYRFTLYQLTLNPQNPTQYLYDGEFRDMQPVPLSIQVKQDDGSLQTVERTLYRTHYGPMVGLKINAPGIGPVNVLPWTNLVGFTIRDVNAENDRLLNQFAKWNQAKSLTEFKALQKSILGIPWVNTVASGPGERAYYADITVVPNVTDEQRTTCDAQPLASVFDQLVPGVPLLDGSNSACEWGTDADAPAPGIFGPSNLPSLERDDYVTNCNDSYWLVNSHERITGYNRIIGEEETPRSLRTRLCLLQADRRIAGTDGREGRKFTFEQLKDIVLASDLLSVELARQTVLDTICPLGFAIGTTGPVDIGPACAVLAAWDGRANLDSKGAHLWREFWRRAIGAPGGLPVNPLAPAIWNTPFSADDPVNTPRDLNTLLPTVQAALADAVTAVEAAGFALDAPLGEVQHSGIHDEYIPVFGGTGTEGAFTIVSPSGPLGESGYEITYGNSYIQAVTWRDGKVHAEGFVTYSQSTDPASPHYADFTREYAGKRWHKFPFTPEEIEAQKIAQYTLRE